MTGTSEKVEYIGAISKDRYNSRLAKELWERSKPLSGTPAEKYIKETRKITGTCVDALQIRSLTGPLGISQLDENTPYNDYVVIPVYGIDNLLIGIQLIQIDESGNKAQNPQNNQYYCKKYFGALKPLLDGRVAVINKSSNEQLVFLAEGIETAASISCIDEIANKYTILASLGVTHLTSTLVYLQANCVPGATVVMLKDHDKPGSKADMDFIEAQALFERAGFHVLVKIPATLDEDWNDVLIKGNVTGLTREFDPAFINELNTESSQLCLSFREVRTALVAAEVPARNKSLLATLIKIMSELEQELTVIGEYDVKEANARLYGIIQEMRTIRALLREFSGKNLSLDSKEIEVFSKAYNYLLTLELEKKRALSSSDDVEDITIWPKKYKNGHVYNAREYVMIQCNSFVNSLSKKEQSELRNAGMVFEHYETRVQSIEQERNGLISLLKKLPACEDEVRLNMENRLHELEIEKRFHLKAMKLHQAKSINRFSSHKAKPVFHKRFKQFADTANTAIKRGKVQAYELRGIISKAYDAEYRKLSNEYNERIKTAQERCLVRLGAVVEELKEELQKQKFILQIKERDENARPEFAECQEVYVVEMERCTEPSAQRQLQEWINNMGVFSMMSILSYRYPAVDEAYTEVDVEHDLLGYDSDVEDSLERLSLAILHEVNGTRTNNLSLMSQDNLDVEEEIAQVDLNDCNSDALNIIEQLSAEYADSEMLDEGSLSSCLFDFTRQIQTRDISKLGASVCDYVEKLALSLHETFEIVEPGIGIKLRQEFDGIALRDSGLTIVERKTNDGTGVKYLQRNFCQGKILSKQSFINKQIIDKVLALVNPEQYIDIKVPHGEAWYSGDFTANHQALLVQAAKKVIVNTLRDVKIEFTLNRPKFFARDDYKGLFFGPGISSVSVRFSECGKGNEDIANRLSAEALTRRSQKRKERFEAKEVEHFLSL